jgi:hypothetical protein
MKLAQNRMSLLVRTSVNPNSIIQAVKQSVLGQRAISRCAM